MSSAVSQSSLLGCSVYRYRCSALGSQRLIGALLFGTYLSLKPVLISSLRIPAGLSMEPSTATLASLKVLLRKSPTLQTFHRSMRTCQLHGTSAARLGRCNALLIGLQYQTHSSPTIGGSLSRPTERFPDTFGNSEFLRKYPYFLPCAVSATFSAFAWILTFVFLREVSVEPKI